MSVFAIVVWNGRTMRTEIRQCPSGSPPFHSLCSHPGAGPHYHFFLDYCSWFWHPLLWTILHVGKGNRSMAWPVCFLAQETLGPPFAFGMVFKLLHARIWLSFPALSHTPLLHTFRFSQMEPDTYSQYPPYILETRNSPRHESLDISFMDPSILSWANIIFSFPKSPFAWHLSMILNYNYFIVLCEHIEN